MNPCNERNVIDYLVQRHMGGSMIDKYLGKSAIMTYSIFRPFSLSRKKFDHLLLLIQTFSRSTILPGK